jgi:hypothetical protein
MTEIEFQKNQGDRYLRVLDEAGATEQELARFVHLGRRSRLAAFMAIGFIEDGIPVGKAIESCERTEKRLRGGGAQRDA